LQAGTGERSQSAANSAPLPHPRSSNLCTAGARAFISEKCPQPAFEFHSKILVEREEMICKRDLKWHNELLQLDAVLRKSPMTTRNRLWPINATGGVANHE
jgi:hypothetical protein